MESIEHAVIRILIDKLVLAESETVLSASLVNDLGADSLDTIEVIMEIEQEFNIVISDEETEKIETVEDLVNIVIKLSSV